MKLLFKLLVVTFIGLVIWNAVRDRQKFDIDNSIEELYNEILGKLHD